MKKIAAMLLAACLLLTLAACALPGNTAEARAVSFFAHEMWENVKSSPLKCGNS